MEYFKKHLTRGVTRVDSPAGIHSIIQHGQRDFFSPLRLHVLTKNMFLFFG